MSYADEKFKLAVNIKRFILDSEKQLYNSSKKLEELLRMTKGWMKVSG